MSIPERQMPSTPELRAVVEKYFSTAASDEQLQTIETQLRDIFYNARWQINANGFYQLPKGFEVGANIFGRQGYVEPLIINADAGG